MIEIGPNLMHTICTTVIVIGVVIFYYISVKIS
jgi:hypothetical protein